MMTNNHHKCQQCNSNYGALNSFEIMCRLTHRVEELEKLRKQLCNLELYNKELESKLLMFKKYESDTLNYDPGTQNATRLRDMLPLPMDLVIKILFQFSHDHFSGELGFAYRDHPGSMVRFFYVSEEKSFTLGGIPLSDLREYHGMNIYSTLNSMKYDFRDAINKIKALNEVHNVSE